MAKYRIWFNTLPKGPIVSAAAIQDVLANPWIVQEADMGHQTAPKVTIETEVYFVKGPPGSTPQGWAECEGQASRDGQTNAIVIKPL